ncbi:MAG: DUF1320 domain-containing protein, partial [Pseudomonadota bacterium]
ITSGSTMPLGTCARSVNVTSSSVPSGMVDPDVIERALADTDSLVNGYISARYALPIAPDAVPPLLTDVAGAIAIYKLHTYDPDPKIIRDYEMALAMLRKISEGSMRLSIAGVAAEDTGGSGARLTDRERPLTNDNLKGFI